MIIKLTREDKQTERTIGTLEFGSTWVYSLEDTDRGLRSDLPLEGIKAIKVQNKTAIPYGRYEVVITYSNRFKKPLPLLLNVPGFEGIRIHSGNTEHDTEGCILLGTTRTGDRVLNSRIAMGFFMKWLQQTLTKSKIYIEIVK